MRGKARAEIFIPLAPAMSHEPALFPRFAPNITPIPCDRLSREADTKDIESTETKEELCIIAVATAPKLTLLIAVFVEVVRIFSKNPPLKVRNPFPRLSIPKSKIASPALTLVSAGLVETKYIIAKIHIGIRYF